MSIENLSASAKVYSFTHGLEEICVTDDQLGILESTLKSQDLYQVLRGSHKIFLWNISTMINPLSPNKKFQKEKRKLEKYISILFEANGDGIFSSGFSQYKVETKITDQCKISSYISTCATPVVFQPFSFVKDDERIGGAFFTLSSTSSNEKKRTFQLNKSHTIKKIITGICLRPNLLMITENGDSVDLAEKVFLNDANANPMKIVNFKKVDGAHPYETANMTMLRNLFPFFAAISQSSSPLLLFHFPLAEHLLHGMRFFLGGNMTMDALDDYADLVIGYASTLQQNLLQTLKNSNIQFSSPLESLTRNAVISTGSFTSHFFQDLGVPLGNIELGLDMDRIVAAAALEYLKEQPGIAGDVWKSISTKVLKDQQDLSLRCLINWSNSVHVALKSFGSAQGEVAVVDDSSERRIIQDFKKYIQTDSWPSLNCFHWLMPVGISAFHSLFHLPVSPDEEICSSMEIEEMINRSSMRISKHAVY